MEEEIWKDIEGYDYPYQVSNLGRVRCLEHVEVHYIRGRAFYYEKKTKMLTKSISARCKYYHVSLMKEHIRKLVLVHRLVAEAFIPNPKGLPFVNHKDEIKTHNSVDNLEWCDHSYNMNYGTIKQRISKKQKGNQNCCKKCYLIDGGEKVLFPSVKSIAGYFDILPQDMSHLLARESNKGKAALFGYCD